MTHTFAELGVSPDTFREIEKALRDAGYDHAFIGDAINMHGIGLVKEGVDPEQAVSDIVRNLITDEARLADVRRYYLAIFGALNNTHDNGEQDALAVMEGLSMMLGQLIGNIPADFRKGIAEFVKRRALFHAEVFYQADKAASVADADGSVIDREVNHGH